MCSMYQQKQRKAQYGSPTCLFLVELDGFDDKESDDTNLWASMCSGPETIIPSADLKKST